MKVINKKDTDFIVSALNSYWHEANNKLTDRKTPMGDIERESHLNQRSRAKEIMDKLENPDDEVFLLVTHSGENNLTTYVVKVHTDIEARLTGTYGDVDDDSEIDHAEIRELIKTLNISYDSGADNIAIQCFPTDENEVKNFTLSIKA